MEASRDFYCASLAGISAVTFTNPIDVLKTKIQLFEHQTLPNNIFAKRNYLHLARQLARHEGGFWKGLQKGLTAAYAYQSVMNGTRFLLYERMKRQNFNLIFASAFSGMIGSFLASPFHMVKVRLQSFATQSSLITGKQHNYSGLLDGLSKVFKSGTKFTDGVLNLFVGSRSLVLRTSIGSCVQLSSYDWAKSFILSNRLFPEENTTLTVLFCGMFAGVVNAIFLSPLDTITTRLYNNNNNSGILDCATNLYRNEGFFAFYRGFYPLLFRIGPHSVLTFVFFETFKSIITDK